MRIITVETPKVVCLNCNKAMECATGIGEEGPQAGSISVCWNCGNIAAFADDLSLRLLTDGEMLEVAGDPMVLAIQKLRKEKPT